MKKEIYDDVIKEEPRINASKKEQKRFDKRLFKSIGWIEPPTKSGSSWDVCLGDESGFACKGQEHAEMIAFLAQINERLKRVEKKIEKNSKSE